MDQEPQASAPILLPSNGVSEFASPAWSPPRPRDRRDFYIAIICALPLEARAVRATFDKTWDDKQYGSAPGDLNAYSTGVVGRHNVVLVHMPNMGKVAAATAATSLRASFPNVQVALVVGVCGAAPLCTATKQEIALGDVVICQGLVQLDLGRRYSEEFVRKDTPQDVLPRLPPRMRAFLAKLQASADLPARLSEQIDQLQSIIGTSAVYPGTSEDILFRHTYRHRHREPHSCPTCQDPIKMDVCDVAVNSSCDELGCDRLQLVARSRPGQTPKPVLHFGMVASADTVMKSAHYRDKAVADDGVIAFEMEGAGVWEKFPGCLVVKGVCDYADGHKNKKFQNFASVTAAAAARILLDNWFVDTSFSEIAAAPAAYPASQPIWDARRVKILERLDVSGYRAGKDRNDDRIEGTCAWFSQHRLFRQWRDSPTSSMLWVSADPGCGKSVLAKYLADTLLATNSTRTTCYFFFKDDFEDQRSARDATYCLLRQLFLQRRDLFTEDVLSLFDVEGKHIFGSFQGIWDVLVSICESDNAGELVFILDAMDEAEPLSRTELSKALCRFYGSRRNSQVKFIITSRPYGDIRRGFQPLNLPGLPVVHLSGEGEEEMDKISKEIDLFIKARVDRVEAALLLGQDERDLLLDQLIRIPNRTYLWVHLVLDLIETTFDIDKEGLATMITNLPKTVNDAYERILSRSSDAVKARTLLHIVVAAQRPLTISEINAALAIHRGRHSYADLGLWPEARFREHIRDLCGLFISIIDSKIYLLHQTAKEFLLRKAPESSSNAALAQAKAQRWKGSLNPKSSHGILASICISHLHFAEFKGKSFSEDTKSLDYVSDHVLLDYSAKNWAYHLRSSDLDADANLEAIRGLCDTSSALCEGWLRLHLIEANIHITTALSPFMLACFLGLTGLARSLAKEGKANLIEKDSAYGRSALSWSSGNGFQDTVQLLLSHWRSSRPRSDRTGSRLPDEDETEEWLDSKDLRNRTPVVHAILGGHAAVVELLLKENASLDQRDAIGQTAFSYGICSGSKAIVDLMLKAGIQPELEFQSQQLLLHAVRAGEEDVVRFLFRAGTVEPDSKDMFGRTPLSVATALGHTGVARLLLNWKDIKLDSRDHKGCSALLLAARHGHVAIVDTLLETGLVDANAVDEDDRTPLSWAAEIGDAVIAKLLLTKGRAHPALPNSCGLAMTPLARAANHGHQDVVELLLATGRAEPDLEDRVGMTALMRALGGVQKGNPAKKDGYENIVKLLMAAQGKTAGDPGSFDDPRIFRYVISQGFDKALGLLLAITKFDVNTTALSGTPLGWAACGGHTAVMKMLLATGRCDVNLADKWGRTPLTWAARYGKIAAVKLLFDTGGPKVEVRDRDGYTPLELAAKHNHGDTVRFLSTAGGAAEDPVG